MKRFSIGLLAAGLAAGLLVAAGCDSEDTKTYDVPIAWNIAGGQGATCVGTLNGPGGSEQVEFDKMAITVYDADDETTPIQQTVEVNCADYQYTISRLDRGSYVVELGAMAEYDGDRLPYYQAEIEIEAPAGADNYEAVLLQGKGRIAVSWSFANNKMCGPNGVAEVAVSLATDERVPCEDGQFIVENLYWSDYSISAIGYDADDTATWSGDCADNPFEVRPGET
ncbi:MAG TPA: hypothetical protein VM285_09435, partial [Polyangia bacterium]|nr:hypothetical protein [Polyangia bacterium]